MKQHAVPENIMDVEFKLFGSLTAKQFGYIVAGGIVGLFFYFVFKSFNSMLLSWVFAVLSVILGLSLALIRINEQPFEIWLGNFLEAMFSSQKRVWRKGKKTPSTVTRGKIQQVPPTPKPITPQLKKLKGIKSVGTVDTQKQKVDKQPSIPSHPFKALDQTQQDVKPIKSDIPMETSTIGTIAGRGVQGETHYIPGSAQGAIKVSTNQKIHRPVSIPGKYKASQTVVSEPAKGVKAPPVSSGDISAKTPTIQVQSHVSPTPSQDTQPYVNKGVIYSDILPKKEQMLQVGDKGVTSQQPSAQLSDQSQDLVDKDRSLRQKVVEISEEKKQLEQQLAKSQEMYSDIKRQNERIVQQLERLKIKPAGTIVEKQAIPVKKVATETTPPVKPKLPRILPKVLRKGDSEEEIFLRPKIYDGPFLTKKPNVISGIVRTSDGNLLPGVIIIVKNEKNRPVRAMKTNSLGQFITTTALENGVYCIELSKSKYSFGKYEIKLTGEILPTYEFIADK